ncbi:MAG: hypothetical protein LBH20_00515, partial [Treponema sp.]|nr:hypothetical protein [Treponema sp.]
MKIKFKLSLMVIAILVAVAGGIAAILLTNATKLARDLSMQNLSNMVKTRTQYWQGREEAHIRSLHTIAALMANYEDIPAEQRRDRFDDMLRDALAAEPRWMRVFSIWKPNAIDGMDSRYIGRQGSTSTGQYAMTYTREFGPIQFTPNQDLQNSMNYINGPNARLTRVDDPTTFELAGVMQYVARLGSPIINPRTGEVVGIVTCVLDLTATQETMMETVKNNP